MGVLDVKSEAWLDVSIRGTPQKKKKKKREGLELRSSILRTFFFVLIKMVAYLLTDN